MSGNQVPQFEALTLLWRLKKITPSGQFRLSALLIPAVLGFFTAVFEAVSLVLLIPTLKGILEMDFTFVRDIPFLSVLVPNLPSVFPRPNAVIFGLLVTLVFVSAVLKNVCLFGSHVSVTRLITGYSGEIRKLIYARYLSFGKLFFDRENLGNLHEVLSKFPAYLSIELRNIENALALTFMLIVSLGLMLAISVPLSLIVLALFPILHYSLSWLVRRMKASSHQFSETNLKLGEKISNSLSCVPLIKAYTNEHTEEKWFNRTVDEHTKASFLATIQSALVQPLQEIVILFTLFCLVSAVAFFLMGQDRGEVASYLVFFILVRRSASHFGALNQVRATLARISGFAGAIYDVFKEEGKHRVHEGKVELGEFKNRVEFCNVNFSYPSRPNVLRDVSFSLDKGHVTALVGPSGSGKTTLVHLLLRFYEASSGKILIDGRDIREMTFASVRSKMALVSQDAYLFNAPLRFNLAYGLNGQTNDTVILEAANKARLGDLLSRVPDGLDTRIGDRGIQLSGGEKQRVSIARAILKGAEILILDEATSSLDTKTEQLIQEAINEAIQGRTAILIAHRLSTIRHADKIVVIEDGKIIEEGVLDELLKREGQFHEYWQAQKFE